MSPTGQVLGHAFTPGEIPAVCRGALPGGKDGLVNCLSTHGFTNVFSYQPASRFWAFQGIESALFVALAAGLVALAYWRVHRFDA